ncbi:MAG: murein biosynthesis integral membrane protein MurJ [Candidatus Promineifilaceae bacterium]
MERARHLVRSSVIVILLLGLGKLTGLLRARLVSSAFGTGPAFDAFTAANQLPEVFVTLIAAGALAAAFIPVYSNYLTSKSSREAAQLANTVITLVILVLGGISLAGIVAAPWLTKTLLVPDFSPELQATTAAIMRIILLQTTLFGVSGALSSILNAHQHFALPALAPITLDVGYLVGLFLFVPTMGIYGLAWGTVVGGALQIVIQVPALRRYSFRYRPAVAVKMAGVLEITRLMGPRIVTLGAVQVADLFIIRLTSGLPAGSTSGYFYAYYLMQFPETLLGTAIAIVVFPTMAELFNAGDIVGLKRTSMVTLRIVWTLTIPAATALVLLGRPTIALLLQGGAFTEASTALVYGVLAIFSIRVVSEASLEILARLFFAQHDTRTPMLVALIWLGINVGLAYILVGSLGIEGLAVASTVAFTLQVLILFILNRRRLGDLNERELAVSGLRSLLGAGAMAGVILVIQRIVEAPLAVVVLGGVGGLVAYLLVTYASGAREIPALFGLLRARTSKPPL